jgi:PAS domain S-box-containing protein
MRTLKFTGISIQLIALLLTADYLLHLFSSVSWQHQPFRILDGLAQPIFNVFGDFMPPLVGGFIPYNHPFDVAPIVPILLCFGAGNIILAFPVLRNLALRMSLTKTAMFLLALPLLAQSALFCGLLCLYFATESSVATARSVSHRHEGVISYILTASSILNKVKDTVEHHRSIDPTYMLPLHRIYDTHNLRFRDGYKDAIADFHGVMQTIAPQAQPVAGRGSAMGYRQSSDEETVLKRVNDARQLINQFEDSSLHNGVFRNGAQLRQRYESTLGATSIMTLCCLLLIILCFSRIVTSRLSIVLDNIARLSAGEKFNKRLSGSDEIAQLDAIFHHVSEELNEAARKERGLIDNAQDLICSLDKYGRFVSVNPASFDLIGFHPNDLVGAWFMDLVSDDQAATVVEELKALLSGTMREPFEIRIKCKDGRTLDMLWSANWSPFEETLFCVAHDISERKAVQRLRKEIVQMVSHDLRSPLTSICAFHEMLEIEMVGCPNQRGREQLTIVEAEIQCLLDHPSYCTLTN